MHRRGRVRKILSSWLASFFEMQRRQFLAATTLGVGAGCLGGTEGPAVEFAPSTDRPPVDSSPEWPMFRNDLANTGCNAETDAPADDLSLEWRYDTATTCDEECQAAGGDAIWGSPALVQGTVYIGSYDGHVYAIDASSGAEQWRFDAGGIVDSSPTVAGETLYVGSWDGNVYALDTETGTERWSHRTKGIVRSSPKVFDGTLYVGSRCGFLECAEYTSSTTVDVGELYAIDAATGERTWQYSTSANVVNTPAIGSGTIYLTSRRGTIHAVSLEDGSELWQEELEGGTQTSPTIIGDVVYVALNGGIYCLDSSTGDEVWAYDDISALITSSPAVTSETVFVGGGFVGKPGEDVARLYAIDRRDGSLRWSDSLSANVVGSSPAVVGERVYFGSHNPGGTPRPDEGMPGVYGYSTTGDRQWEYTPTERVTYAEEDVALPDEGFGSSPAVADGRLVIGGVDGTVYSFT
jgi:outer membrane protein assembly factor BamB